MSTFKGIVAEFPQIRIDYFRPQPDHPPPLACFLSHVHSDHLAGLESLRAPFVYCSPATREILLRLEKYHYRVNYARGILESRQVTYKNNLHKLARPIPLDTPTVIELAPDRSLRVTLFDANHCVGAVMFLIEGNGNAILYTGDIRAERWWVNSIVQNPILLPYATGIRTLDCIYLDTTFASKADPYREFPSKAEGIEELLQKLAVYPDDTTFYFHAWTFGYENVWVALSSFLHSQVHVDQYKYGIYTSLCPTRNKFLRESGLEIREAPVLCGYKNGNRFQHGCLTSEQAVRIHSCERFSGCAVADNPDTKFVRIIPIVTRINGVEIAELGAGGGNGDLNQREELETGDARDIGQLMKLCAEKIDDPEVLSKVLAFLQEAVHSGDGKIDLDSDVLADHLAGDELTFQTLVSVLSSHATKTKAIPEHLDTTIRFPYSRHSSYSELCYLIKTFQPKDVYPCTVDDNWGPEMSMHSLFGECCSAQSFRHDTEMLIAYDAKVEQEEQVKRSQEHTQTQTQDTADVVTPKRRRRNDSISLSSTSSEEALAPLVIPASKPRADFAESSGVVTEAGREQSPSTRATTAAVDGRNKSLPTIRASNQKSAPKWVGLSNKELAYKAALGHELTWAEFGGLTSTRMSPSDEVEL